MTAAPRARSEPIILDTDIGDDIDDAYCLAYLLSQPGCELVGITTTRGDTPVRAAIAEAMCRAAGRDDVPVLAGARATIGFEPVADADGGVPHRVVLDGFRHRDPAAFAPDRATQFLIDRLRERPGEITLLAIGQLTNVAALFAAYPEAPSLLKRLVMMNGVFLTDELGSEWNSRCDPVATWIVYRTPGLDLTAVGNDVTEECPRSIDEELDRLAGLGGPHAIVRACLPLWGEKYERVFYHDPLAAAIVFEPGICTYAQGRVDVELTRTHVGPMTVWTPEPAPGRRHTITTGVSVERFWSHFTSTI